jgi:hypothetical protein
MRDERRELEEKAIRYRRLAREVADQQTAQRILALAEELQSRSAAMGDR